MSTTFGERLKEERKRLGYTQAAFGALAGVERTTQLNYERGPGDPAMTYPSEPYLEAIAEAGADVLYLITGRRSEKPEASSKLENSDIPGSGGKISDGTGSYGKLELGDESWNSVPTSPVKVGTEELALIGKVFFNAWHRMLESHGSDVQRALMTELIGADIAYELVAAQFNKPGGVPKQSVSRKQTTPLGGKKKTKTR